MGRAKYNGGVQEDSVAFRRCVVRAIDRIDFKISTENIADMRQGSVAGRPKANRKMVVVNKERSHGPR